MVLELNEENLGSTLCEKKVTLIDFWASWCGPCKMLLPIIGELGNDNQGKDVNICKINVEEHQNLGANYNVRGIPAVLIFKNGIEVERLIGANPKSKYQELIDKHLVD